MRPKVVIAILVVAICALGLIAFMKGRAGKIDNSGGEQASLVQSQTNLSPAEANQQTSGPGSHGQPAPASEEVRTALIDQETRAIYDLRDQADGSNNLTVIESLLQKFSNPEAEVRQTALRVIKEMNDTNALPGLQKVADNTADPREKVAIMDAMDYIKMPTITDNVQPQYATNRAGLDGPIDTNQHHFNPAFLRGGKAPKLGTPPNPPAVPQNSAAAQSQ